MTAGYIATARIALPTGIVEKGEKFGSDAVPGRAWKPLDKEAKAAIRARDEAEKADAAPSNDPRVGELEARVAELEAENAKQAAEIEALTAPDEPPAADEPAA